MLRFYLTILSFNDPFKGDCLDFSHLTKLRNIYVTEIYMKKQCKSSITKNHKIRKKNCFGGVPLRSLLIYF